MEFVAREDEAAVLEADRLSIDPAFDGFVSEEDQLIEDLLTTYGIPRPYARGVASAILGRELWFAQEGVDDETKLLGLVNMWLGEDVGAIYLREVGL